MNNIKINLYELLRCISNAQDLVSPRLFNHHQQVAYLSYCLAKELNLSSEQQKDIFLAALVHDIGALSINERLEIIEEEPLNVENHAFTGAKLLKDFKPLQNIFEIIKYHHLTWNFGKGRSCEEGEVPIGSHVIHLADRVCLLIGPKQNVLSQLPCIMETINNKRNTIFEPNMVDTLFELAKKEYIWLDLISDSPVSKINTGLFDFVELEIDNIIDLTFIFSQIIDFRSSFTARHSAGVAKVAERLAELIGFTQIECKMMLIAGYLHDLGKLAVDNSVLEKPGKLNTDEFNEIRSHTYYTYQLLGCIEQFNTINEWASYHHERLDGKGYPFHIKGDELSLGSRVMAVADVFTAIMENRPYRKGMEDAQAKEVLENMVASGALDNKVVGVLIGNFQTINELRRNSQQEASLRYKTFLLT